MLVDTISQEVCSRPHREVLHADDLTINDTTVMSAQERFQLWSNAFRDSGLKINVAQAQHMTARQTAEQIELNEEALKNVDHCKYLGVVINRDETIHKDVDAAR